MPLKAQKLGWCGLADLLMLVHYHDHGCNLARVDDSWL